MSFLNGLHPRDFEFISWSKICHNFIQLILRSLSWAIYAHFDVLRLHLLQVANRRFSSHFASISHIARGCSALVIASWVAFHGSHLWTNRRFSSHFASLVVGESKRSCSNIYDFGGFRSQNCLQIAQKSQITLPF